MFDLCPPIRCIRFPRPDYYHFSLSIEFDRALESLPGSIIQSPGKKNNPKSCAKNVDVLFSPLTTKKKNGSRMLVIRNGIEKSEKKIAPDLHHREVRYTFLLSYHREKEIITLFPHPSVTVQNFLHY